MGNKILNNINIWKWISILCYLKICYSDTKFWFSCNHPSVTQLLNSINDAPKLDVPIECLALLRWADIVTPPLLYMNVKPLCECVSTMRQWQKTENIRIYDIYVKYLAYNISEFLYDIYICITLYIYIDIDRLIDR